MMVLTLLTAALVGPRYESMVIAGWTVQVRTEILTEQHAEWQKAKPLMLRQLTEVAKVLPKPAVERLRKVTLWVGPEYPGEPAAAAYHPGAQWLTDHGRDPAMARGIEFNNIKVFEAETRRMPNFCLHELAHAYHHQVLPDGFDNKALKLAFEAAKATGQYESVLRRDSEGVETKGRHYAMTDQMEFFAEMSESYFVTNDFQPWNREGLIRFDPASAQAVRKAWGAP